LVHSLQVSAFLRTFHRSRSCRDTSSYPGVKEHGMSFKFQSQFLGTVDFIYHTICMSTLKNWILSSIYFVIVLMRRSHFKLATLIPGGKCCSKNGVTKSEPYLREIDSKKPQSLPSGYLDLEITVSNRSVLKSAKAVLVGKNVDTKQQIMCDAGGKEAQLKLTARRLTQFGLFSGHSEVANSKAKLASMESAAVLAA
jgi:hypothetical protein